MSHKRPIPSTLLSDSTATGRSLLTATDAAAARAAVAPVTTPSLVSEAAGGWTPVAVQAPGQVTVTGGEIVTSYSGASTTNNAGGFETRAWPSGVGGEYVFTARVQIENNAGSATVAYANIAYPDGLFYWFIRASGTADFSANFSGGTTFVSGVSLPVDGTGWVRVRVVGSRITVWTGVGVGTAEPLPSAWTLRYHSDYATLIGKGAPVSVTIGGSQRDTTSVGATTTYRWSQISIRDLSVGA